MKTSITIPVAPQNSATALRRALSSNNNDSRAICSWTIETLRDDSWRLAGHATFSEFLAAPHSLGGCKSSLGVIVAHAFNHPGVLPMLLKVVTPAEVEAIQKQTNLLKGQHLRVATKPALPPKERGGGRPPKRSRSDETVLYTTQQGSPKRDTVRSHLNMLRYRAANPTHPKHEQAKVLLEEVERGEITPGTARQRMIDDPLRGCLTRAKTYTRALDAATRAEFLQWLLDQGAVLTINPDFIGFTDGRKPKATP